MSYGLKSDRAIKPHTMFGVTATLGDWWDFMEALVGSEHAMDIMTLTALWVWNPRSFSRGTHAKVSSWLFPIIAEIMRVYPEAPPDSRRAVYADLRRKGYK